MTDKKPDRTVAPNDEMLTECQRLVRKLDKLNPEVRAWVLNYCCIKYNVDGLPATEKEAS